MKKQLIVLSYLVFHVFFAHSVNFHAYKPLFVRHKKKEFCYISFVDINGTSYITKQKRQCSFFLSVVYDVLASRIAESLDNKIAHKVILIPASQKFLGKKYRDWPATLHTIVPGKSILDQRSSYSNINLRQAIHGFTREMIYWMSKHKDLPAIVALDIFLCNHDRHRGNLFYNRKTDSFYAIDMDLLFESRLARLAIYNLRRMSSSDIAGLTEKEVRALCRLRTMLERLVDQHDAESMVQLFDTLIEEAGLMSSCSYLNVEMVSNTIAETREKIRENYEDTKELIVVLSHIVDTSLKR